LAKIPGAVLALVAAAASVGPLGAASGGIRQETRPKERFRPKIIGTPRIGAVLRATHGIWASPGSVIYTYRWSRCPAGGGECLRIPRASRPRFRPTGVEIGATLRVTVTATSAAGSARATSRATKVVSGSDKAPVALWHMDETSGTVMKDSAHRNDGTLYQVTLGAAGVKDRAYGFNGHRSYVSVPSTNDLNPGTAMITITLHLRTTSLPHAAPADFDLIRKGAYQLSASEYKVELQHSGQASCGFQGSAGYSELIAGPRLNDGRWHQLQCIKAPSAIQLVVDGKPFTQPANVGSISNSAPLVIGAHPAGDWYLGTLDEVSIRIG
jgi:Concanavalin A-like lectin/glucanases superfamily